jgi:hypothetical protein
MMFPVPAHGRSCPQQCRPERPIVINAGFVQNTMQDRSQQEIAQ